MKTTLTALLLSLVALVPLAATAQSNAGSWLTPPYASWNTPGMAIPIAGPADTEFASAFCASEARTPETSEDRAVAGAGWTLFDAYSSGWGIKIVDGETGYDGMCRPLDWQSFVFVHGVFAGTLSPVDMAARTSGSLISVRILPNSLGLVAEYAKYGQADPFCCPSQDVLINYDIKFSGDLPVVTPYSPTSR